MSTTDSALRSLARKYRTLAAVRVAGGATRAELRALAAEFPGALRELDSLPLHELQSRAAALDAAAAAPEATGALDAALVATPSARDATAAPNASVTGAPVEPWMLWLIAWNAYFRAALWLKAHPSDVRGASARAGLAIDQDFAAAVACPPRRRLVRAVLERVARDFGEAPDAIEARLFPPHPSRR